MKLKNTGNVHKFGVAGKADAKGSSKIASFTQGRRTGNFKGGVRSSTKIGTR